MYLVRPHGRKADNCSLQRARPADHATSLDSPRPTSLRSQHISLNRACVGLVHQACDAARVFIEQVFI